MTPFTLQYGGKIIMQLSAVHWTYFCNGNTDYHSNGSTKRYGVTCIIGIF